VQRAYLSALGAAAAIVLPLNAGMAVAAAEIVVVVLGPQWLGTIDVLPWLLLASSIALLGHFAGVVVEARAALNGKIWVRRRPAGRERASAVDHPDGVLTDRQGSEVSPVNILLSAYACAPGRGSEPGAGWKLGPGTRWLWPSGHCDHPSERRRRDRNVAS
jgi:hypothetical protein